MLSWQLYREDAQELSKGVDAHLQILASEIALGVIHDA